jgi:hypothetical protein
MLDYRLDFFSYFGSDESTLSSAERQAGMVSAYPFIHVGKLLPENANPTTATAPQFDKTPQLVVEGQGTIAVQITPGSFFSIALTPSVQLKDNETALKLELTDKSAKFFAVTTQTQMEITSVMPKGLDAARLIPGVADMYWFSIDKKNGYIRYGKTYRTVAVTALQSKVDVGDETDKPGPFLWVKKLRYIAISSMQGGSVSVRCVAKPMNKLTRLRRVFVLILGSSPLAVFLLSMISLPLSLNRSHSLSKILQLAPLHPLQISILHANVSTAMLQVHPSSSTIRTSLISARRLSTVSVHRGRCVTKN